MGGVGEELGQFAFGDYFAIEEVNLALGVGGKAIIVRDHADGGAFGVQLCEELHDGFTVLAVEVSGGFIGEQDGGRAGEGAGHGDALLLTAGELGRVVAHAVGHADTLKGCG